jgi:translation initiation factor 6
MIKQISINNEEFIGLFGMCTDKYAIVSENFLDIEAEIEIFRTKIYDTNLVGIFCVGNSNGLLVSDFIREHELKNLKKIGKEIGINVEKIKEDFNAIGNLIACNDKGAIISKKILNKDAVEDILGVECVVRNISNHEEVGSCIVPTNKGFVVHPDAEDEISEIEEIFKVSGKPGSVNLGIPYVRSGIIANSSLAIIGEKSTHIEVERIIEALNL